MPFRDLLCPFSRPVVPSRNLLCFSRTAYGAIFRDLRCTFSRPTVPFRDLLCHFSGPVVPSRHLLYIFRDLVFLIVIGCNFSCWQTYSAVEVASRYFRAGADKISLGSDAVYAAEVSWSRKNWPNPSYDSCATSYKSGNPYVECMRFNESSATDTFCTHTSVEKTFQYKSNQ